MQLSKAPSVGIRFAIYLICIVLSGGCAGLTRLAVGAADEADYEASYLAAELAKGAGDHRRAIGILTPYRSFEDCPPEVLVSLAESLFREGLADQAWEVVDECVERYPRFVPARRLRVTVHRLKNRNAEAIADLEGALEVEPRHGAMLQELGELRYRGLLKRRRDIGKEAAYEELIDTYSRLEEAKRGSRKIPPLLILASLYSELGKNDEAVAAARRATLLRPRSLRAQLTLAEAYTDGDRPAEALETYRQALLIDPRNQAVRVKVAELLKKQGRAGGLQGRSRHFPALSRSGE